jgi:hypothetical protein
LRSAIVNSITVLGVTGLVLWVFSDSNRKVRISSFMDVPLPSKGAASSAPTKKSCVIGVNLLKHKAHLVDPKTFLLALKAAPYGLGALTDGIAVGHGRQAEKDKNLEPHA